MDAMSGHKDLYASDESGSLRSLIILRKNADHTDQLSSIILFKIMYPQNATKRNY